MIKIQGKLPRKVYLACSGGIDSMAILHFLCNNHDVTVLHFDHRTEHSLMELDLVDDFCLKNNIKFEFGRMPRQDKPKDQSYEEYWREERYEFLDKFTDAPVITAHHLDDCVETWIFSSLHGTGKIVPYRRKNIIRPFRLNLKRDIALWANMHNVQYVEDPTNTDTKYARNYIRHTLMPHALKVNPGLHKTIKKKVIENGC
jgi:tRNA(Ile)-lysidine synthetase-like protein